MLYDNAPPNAIKSSILYVEGGDNIPVGVINSIKISQEELQMNQILK